VGVPFGHHFSVALTIKDQDTARLGADVAELAHETKTQAVKIALEERRAHLVGRRVRSGRGDRLRRFLVDEAWPQLAPDALGTPPSKADREDILGHGPEGL
jgi:antitoxin VapB